MASVAPNVETRGVLDAFCCAEAFLCCSEDVDLYVWEDE